MVSRIKSFEFPATNQCDNAIAHLMNLLSTRHFCNLLEMEKLPNLHGRSLCAHVSKIWDILCICWSLSLIHASLQLSVERNSCSCDVIFYFFRHWATSPVLEWSGNEIRLKTLHNERKPWGGVHTRPTSWARGRRTLHLYFVDQTEGHAFVSHT